MTAASADLVAPVSVRGASQESFKVASAVAVYANTYMALAGPNHATSAKKGYLIPFTGAAGEIPVGYKIGAGVTGDLTAAPIVESAVSLDERIQVVTVAGIAGTIADVGKLVYISDDSTYTLTRPTRGSPQGMIVRQYNATQVAVLMLSVTEKLVLAMAGRGREIMPLGELAFNSMSDATLKAFAMPFACDVVDFYAITNVATTGGSGACVLLLKNGATAVTGAAVTCNTADAVGVKNSTTAITALNHFSEGDTLNVVGSSSAGTRTLGSYSLFLLVQKSIEL